MAEWLHDDRWRPLEAEEARGTIGLGPLRTASRIIALVVCATGVAVLGGWFLNIPRIESFLPGPATMKPNTAAGFALAGASLWLLSDSSRVRLRKVGAILALLTLLIGFLTIVEFASGHSLGIDQILFQGAAPVSRDLPPGRMAPVTSLDLFCLGGALMLLYPRGTIRLAQGIAVIPGFTSMMALVGYFYDANSLYAIRPFARIAFHTAAASFLLFAGIFCSRPDRGLMILVSTRSNAGNMARRVLPLCLLLPVLIGWIRLRGQQSGVFDPDFGQVVGVTFAAFVLGAVVLWSARSIYRIDRDREAKQRALQQAQEKYQSIFENAVEGIYQSTADGGRYTAANPSMAVILGYSSPQEVVDSVNDIGHEVYADPDQRAEFLRILHQHGVVKEMEVQLKRKDGRKIWASMSARAIRDPSGAFSYNEGSLVDITERRHLEEQFRQSQKMEAIGQLAGGVAHDFNNLLTVILGYTELIQENGDGADRAAYAADEISKAARRAADLTSQLLAFSRRQVLQPKVVSLNDVLKNTGEMLQRLIGKSITLVCRLDPGLGQVQVDRGQMELVVMNLVVNARDAMAAGGALTLETRSVTLNETGADHPDVPSGRYAMLAVTDNGSGMDAQTRERIFEPFFTTKELGHGTGLGLSTVFGIVKQSGGQITVQSEPGRGTTFNIYLPLVDPSSESPQTITALAETLTGSETILLVEDEAPIRELVHNVLRAYGYRVLDAANAFEAVQLFERHDGQIHLMLTDLMMPDMSGRELARSLKPSRPEMRILYMSGYSDRGAVSQDGLEANAGYLQKPFTPQTLLSKVRQVIDATGDF